MKKNALILFCLFVSIAVQAQITVSPVFGANFSKIAVKGSSKNIETGLRYYAGIQAKHDFSNKFSTGLGLLYNVKGYDFNTIDTGAISNTWFNYLDISPFVEFRPVERLGIIAGGAIGFNIKENYYLFGVKEKVKQKLNNSIDIGVFIGVRYYINRVFLSLQYTSSVVSMSDIYFTDANGNLVGGPNVYNQTLALGVGYNFHLKKK